MTSDEIRFRKEIFEDKVYGEPAIGLVVDIGAHVGLYAEYCRNAKRIYCIEPQIDNYLRLISRTAELGLRNIIAFNCAIASDNRDERNIYAGDSDGSYSLIQAGGAQKLTGTVKTMMLRTFMKYNHIRTIDTLKVDCEGSENEIINSDFKEIARRIKRVVGEIHFGDEKIFDVLKANDYTIVKSGTNTFEAVKEI